MREIYQNQLLAPKSARDISKSTTGVQFIPKGREFLKKWLQDLKSGCEPGS